MSEDRSQLSAELSVALFIPVELLGNSSLRRDSQWSLPCRPQSNAEGRSERRSRLSILDLWRTRHNKGKLPKVPARKAHAVPGKSNASRRFSTFWWPAPSLRQSGVRLSCCGAVGTAPAALPQDIIRGILQSHLSLMMPAVQEDAHGLEVGHVGGRIISSF